MGHLGPKQLGQVNPERGAERRPEIKKQLFFEQGIEKQRLTTPTAFLFERDIADNFFGTLDRARNAKQEKRNSQILVGTSLKH